MARKTGILLAAIAAVAATTAQASETRSFEALPKQAGPAFVELQPAGFCAKHPAALSCSRGSSRLAPGGGHGGGGGGGGFGGFSPLSIAQLAMAGASLGLAIHINNQVSNPNSR